MQAKLTDGSDMDTGENPFTATQPEQEYQDADVYVVQDSSPDAQPFESEKAQVKLDEL